MSFLENLATKFKSKKEDVVEKHTPSTSIGEYSNKKDNEAVNAARAANTNPDRKINDINDLTPEEKSKYYESYIDEETRAKQEIEASKELRANMAAKAAARTEAEAAAKGKDQQAADDLSAEIKAGMNQN